MERQKQFAGVEGMEGSMHEYTQQIDEGIRESMKAPTRMEFMKKDQIESTLSDFTILKMIGKGSFGKVFLVEHNQTKAHYAMKCIRKDVILEHDQLENIRLEKDILNTINHPFLVNMEFVFQNENRIYFLMKFIKGGELFRHFVQVKRFPEEHVRFFAA
jgi:serine/threonine protein kinase